MNSGNISFDFTSCGFGTLNLASTMGTDDRKNDLRKLISNALKHEHIYKMKNGATFH